MAVRELAPTLFDTAFCFDVDQEYLLLGLDEVSDHPILPADQVLHLEPELSHEAYDEDGGGEEDADVEWKIDDGWPQPEEYHKTSKQVSEDLLVGEHILIGVAVEHEKLWCSAEVVVHDCFRHEMMVVWFRCWVEASFLRS